jgi:hypothetical protein
MVSWDGYINKDAGTCFTVYSNMCVETLWKTIKTQAILTVTGIHVVSLADSIVTMIYASNNNSKTQLKMSIFSVHFRLYIIPQLSTFE